jgi:hypothetical protein
MVVNYLRSRSAQQAPPYRDNATRAPTPKTQPFRGVRYTSYYYYQRALRLWRWILLSLPLDLLLLLSVLSVSVPRIVLITTGVVTFAAPWRRTLARQLFSLRTKRETLSRKLFQKPLLLMLALLGASLLKFLPFIQEFGLYTLVGVAVVAVVAWRATVKDTLETAIQQEFLAQNIFAWIEYSNRFIFYTVIAPIVASRIFAVCCLLQAETLEEGMFWFALALFGVLLTYPELDLFAGPCKRCGAITSLVVQDLRCCPRCTPEMITKTIDELRSKQLLIRG